MPETEKLKHINADSPEVEVVQDYNINILDNMGEYLAYLRREIKQILIDDELHYSDPMEKKKIYPDFTYTQFLYILGRLFDRVFSVNTALLYISYTDKYNKVYDIPKVELCYEVYCRLCQYYGFMCSSEGFSLLTGVDEVTLREWSSLGRSKLVNLMLENGKKQTLARFENSKNPLLSLAAANYKYKLNESNNERIEAASLDVLPDLLTLPGVKKPPELGQNPNCTND